MKLYEDLKWRGLIKDISSPDLIDKLIQLAIKRHKEKNSLNTNYLPKNDWYKKGDM
jgi:hypothetical protein